MPAELRLPAAAIFDMDGVLIDSSPFHLQKWIDLLTERQIPFEREELARRALGPRNGMTLRHYFSGSMSEAEIVALSCRLEEKFRNAIRPHAKPLPGVERLLTELQQAGMPMAVASAAMRPNIEFLIDLLKLRPYFRCLVSGDDVPRSKPDPLIYLKAAAALCIDPARCVAFEDTFVGVEAAKGAGMKCVAIASTFPAAELRERTGADLVILSFADLRIETLQRLFGSDSHR